MRGPLLAQRSQEIVQNDRFGGGQSKHRPSGERTAREDRQVHLEREDLRPQHAEDGVPEGDEQGAQENKEIKLNDNYTSFYN